MRKIKFRKWHKELQDMTLWDGAKGSNNLFWYTIAEYPDMYFLMQYTGFKDKNGKEIYEGDILGDWVEVDGEMEQSKLQVYFDEKLGQWMLDHSSNQDKSYSYALFDELQNFDYKVIGNVYENPTN